MSQSGMLNTNGGSGSGTVTSVSVVSSNGFSGTVANPTTTPAITLATTQTGVLSGDGTSISGSAITQHDVLIGGTSNAITSISPNTAGLVLTSNGVSSDPSFQAVSASGSITMITGNDSVSEVPSAGNFNIIGTGSITTAGSSATETISLTGLTSHAVLIGAGTATITKVGPSSDTGAPLISGGAVADPAFSTTFTVNDAAFIAIETGEVPGGTTQIACVNTSTSANSSSRIDITAAGTSASGNDSYIFFDQGSSAASFEAGVQSSTNTFQIQAAPDNAHSYMDGTTVFSMTEGGLLTLPAVYGNTVSSPVSVVMDSSGTLGTQPNSGMVLLQNSTPPGGASSSVVFTLVGYENYLMVTQGLFPNSGGDQIYVLLSTDGGATYLGAGNYVSGVQFSPYNASLFSNYNSTSQIYISGPVHANGGGPGLFSSSYFATPQTTFSLQGTGFYLDTTIGVQGQEIYSGQGPGSTNITTIKVTCDSGLLNFGTINFYGLTSA